MSDATVDFLAHVERDKVRSRDDHSGARAAKPAPERAKSQKSPACQYSKLEQNIGLQPAELGLTDDDELEIEVFSGGGMRVSWPLAGPEWYEGERDLLDDSRHGKNDLARLRRSNQQGTKSRLRAAWTLSNATVEWSYMTTLTYRPSSAPSDYETVARHRKAFLRLASEEWPELVHAWILEFHASGVPHYHVFWAGEAAEVMAACRSEIYQGRKFDGVRRDREVVRGYADDLLVGFWDSIVGDGSRQFERFQSGGITEKLRDPQGAGKYVAKECAKRAQKNGPFLVGQWFGLSKSARPRLTKKVTCTVGDYRAAFGDRVMRHLF